METSPLWYYCLGSVFGAVVVIAFVLVIAAVITGGQGDPS